MIDPEAITPSEQSTPTPTPADLQTRDEQTIKDLAAPDANAVKGGAVNAYLIVDGRPSTSKDG